MPDRVGVILKGIYEAGEYHKAAKSTEKYKKKDIDQARSELLKVVLEEVNKANKRYGDKVAHYEYWDGFNQAIDDVIEAMERMFG